MKRVKTLKTRGTTDGHGWTLIGLNRQERQGVRREFAADACRADRQMPVWRIG
ncbi:MAG: hypothetical protein ACOYCD_10090 [Kiritimatiellia bacterium]